MVGERVYVVRACGYTLCEIRLKIVVSERVYVVKLCGYTGIMN